MSAVESPAIPTIQTIYLQKDRQIAAPLEIVFETLLQPLGPMTGLSLKLEPWPGGRWYRDLGNDTGHLWGHVQVIKPPKLLELCGPMFMSYAVTSHIQYRLMEKDGGTHLSLIHQAIGFIEPEDQEGVNKGWSQCLDDVKSLAEKQAGKK